MKLGLFGGTFNPIHIGHLKIARKVLDDFGLDKLIFIPSGNPPHKSAGEIAGAFHRLKMLELAIADEACLALLGSSRRERFEVSDIEIKRKGTSYTLDTIKQIKEIYGKDTILYFIAGADMALDLPNWKCPLKILELSHFIAVQRPNFSLEKLNEEYPQKMIFVEGVSIEVSSSDIRKRIKEGKTIKTLVPEAVEKYIKDNALFI